MKFLFFLVLLVSTFVSFSQSLITEASLSSTGLMGNGNNLPFWMVQNQLGKYSSTGNWQELTEGTVMGSTKLFGAVDLTYGADLAVLISEKGIDLKIIQAFIGLSGKVIGIKAGAFADKELMGGLSSTNGDLLRSMNYRPYPKVSLSTPGFIPFLVAKSWFRIKAEYEEGLLTDERVIDQPHLHHKSLMLQFLPSPSLRFTMGINHYVFWGGRSDQYDQFPSDLNSYVRYVTGRPGGSDFLETDQLNVAGNHLGSYLFTAQKDFENFQLELRVSHPFEDGSGMGFENTKDNLYSIHFRKNETGAMLDELVFEYLYSKHQSGDRSLEAGLAEEHKRGGDSYFNHGVYTSGFTYEDQIMGTPLFGPIRKNQDGVVVGVANNRVSAFHVGVKGYLSNSLRWKGMVTYSRNFGTYDQPYDPFRQQIYSLWELSWKSKDHPLLLSAFTGIDMGQLSEDQLGIGLQAQWTFR